MALRSPYSKEMNLNTHHKQRYVEKQDKGGFLG